MKKTFLFILALAILMLVAIPATAGPLASPVLIESAMPALLTAPVQASVTPNIYPVFESSPPFFARISQVSDLIVSDAFARPNYLYSLMAALAGLTCGVGLILNNRLLKYDPRDRMHGLARDQDSRA